MTAPTPARYPNHIDIDADLLEAVQKARAYIAWKLAAEQDAKGADPLRLHALLAEARQWHESALDVLNRAGEKAELLGVTP